MPALTPSFLFDFESNMRTITENEYARLASKVWWQSIMKTRPSQSRREMLAWLLSTAKIEDLGRSGGSMFFEDVLSTFTEFENRHAGAGLKLKRAQIEDLDGNGLEVASKWSADIGAYAAYWPQKKLVEVMKNGHTASLVSSYDGLAFFAASHPFNPKDASKGTFNNLFTGAASGSYPGACPIDASVSLDVALNNLAKIVAYIKSIKMPNGEDPRFLSPTTLIVPPALQARAVQLTNAKFLAQAASSGGGSGDVESVIQSFGWKQPIVADEFAGYESDTTFFVGCEELSSSQLGAMIYSDREPFKITYYTGRDGGGAGMDFMLDRADELEWHQKGRNVVAPGHPFLLFKCKGS